MDTKPIDIKGIDKAVLLAALYNASKQQGMGFLQTRGARSMSVEEAKKEIEQNPRGYYDYLHGRVMKSDISKDTFDPWGYDRDNGSGSAERVINSIR